MRISQLLPQFENKKALIIVSGDQTAELYTCYKGRMEKKENIEIERPTYLDREGFFAKSAGGRMLGSGAVYANLKNYVESKFLKKLKEKVGDTMKEEDIREIYLFSPEYMSGMILDYLGSPVCSAFNMLLKGNFTGRHPYELLKKIQKTYRESVGQKVPSRLEAFKILEKAKKAQAVMG